MGFLNFLAVLFCVGRAGTETIIRDGKNENYMKKVRESGQMTYIDDRGRTRWTKTGELCYYDSWKDGSCKIISRRTGRVLWDKEVNGFLKDKIEFDKRSDRFTIAPIKKFDYMYESEFCRVDDVFLIDKTRDNMIVIPSAEKIWKSGSGIVYEYSLVYFSKNNDTSSTITWKVVDKEKITKDEWNHITKEIMHGFLNRYNIRYN